MNRRAVLWWGLLTTGCGGRAVTTPPPSTGFRFEVIGNASPADTSGPTLRIDSQVVTIRGIAIQTEGVGLYGDLDLSEPHTVRLTLYDSLSGRPVDDPLPPAGPSLKKNHEQPRRHPERTLARPSRRAARVDSPAGPRVLERFYDDRRRHSAAAGPLLADLRPGPDPLLQRSLFFLVHGRHGIGRVGYSVDPNDMAQAEASQHQYLNGPELAKFASPNRKQVIVF